MGAVYESEPLELLRFLQKSNTDQLDLKLGFALRKRSFNSLVRVPIMRTYILQREYTVIIPHTSHIIIFSQPSDNAADAFRNRVRLVAIKKIALTRTMRGSIFLHLSAKVELCIV